MSKPNDRFSVAHVREALQYDSETGEFRWRMRPAATPQWNGKYPGRAAGTINDRGYVIITIDQIDCRAHRLAWAIMTGEWPACEIDHRNLNRSDNRWTNLRQATHSQNGCNRPAQANNTSGFKGVSYCRITKRWVARIRLDGKYPIVARCSTPEEAAIAYQAASRQIHGAFARHTAG